MSQLPANLPGKSLLPRLAAFLPCALAALLLAGCGGGGGPDASRKQVMANVNWEFAKDAVMVEVAAAPNLNEYAGQSHTLLLGVYQMADPAPFYKMLADSNALARSLSSEKGGAAYAGGILAVLAFLLPLTALAHDFVPVLAKPRGALAKLDPRKPADLARLLVNVHVLRAGALEGDSCGGAAVSGAEDGDVEPLQLCCLHDCFSLLSS